MALRQQLVIKSPVPFQVVQRKGFDPTRAHEHEPGGPALGQGQMSVVVATDSATDVKLEYRVVPCCSQGGDDTESWLPLPTTITVPAGGWYKLEVRREGATGDIASVEPIGVGEVFIIAGQSYAAGTNDELLRIEDPEGRASAYDVLSGTWQVAHDPPPNNGDGGSIWPPMCDALLPLLRVPIGLVNVSAGGTASRQWLPGERLYERLAEAGKTIGDFRAVFWQQGESDVIEKVSEEDYIRNILKIRDSLADKWGFKPPWLPAKSTLHPMIYNDIEGENRIRSAIAKLWGVPGFVPGPDTDVLGGENRGGEDSRQHFSGMGQRNAGMMWFATVWNFLNSNEYIKGT